MNPTVAKWIKYKGQADAFRKLEVQARQQVIDEIFAPQGLVKEEGTSRVDADKYVLVATFRMNYKVTDNEKLAIFLKTLPTWQRQQLIKYTPTVMLTGYRKLEPSQLKQLKRSLEITPGIPGLAAEPK